MEEEEEKKANVEEEKKEPKKTFEEPKESIFECNICLEIPAEPMVTRCGHLFCWNCIY